jgi:hypothetical protein
MVRRSLRPDEHAPRVPGLLVSVRHRLAYLAMPKTGSTAVEEVLRPRADLAFGGDPRIKHMPLRRYQRFVEPLLGAYGVRNVETVCLFREPVDWLISWYRYRRREAVRDHPNSTAGLSFEAFAEGYLADDPPSFARVGRPAQFVAGREGRPGIDHLFRYENFAGFAAFLSARFGRQLTFPPANASPADAVPCPPALRARIEAGMAEECRIWRELAR